MQVNAYKIHTYIFMDVIVPSTSVSTVFIVTVITRESTDSQCGSSSSFGNGVHFWDSFSVKIYILTDDKLGFWFGMID